jgi:polyhydroxyalkanoate synthase
VASLTLLVCALDNAQAGTVSALTSRELAAAAVAESARKGYLDGRALAGVFAWLRPNDLIWTYSVNNYLLGRTPPAFDVLHWNQDTVRLAAGLHRDSLLLGRGARFVLSTSGHIQALVNPPGPDIRASYHVSEARRPDAADWLDHAATERGSWWPDYVGWLAERSGERKPAPKRLGSRGHKALAKAPGSYVHAG